MSHLVTNNANPNPETPEDPTADPRVQDPEPAQFESTTFESEDALKRAVKIVAECKSAGDRMVTLFKDENNNVYALAKADDHTLKKNTVLGSVGSGRVSEKGSEFKGVPWELPHGDRTLVRVHEGADEEGEEPAGNVY